MRKQDERGEKTEETVSVLDGAGQSRRALGEQLSRKLRQEEGALVGIARRSLRDP